jgi:hypothetical protein
MINQYVCFLARFQDRKSNRKIGEITEKFTEEVKSSAFNVLARPKSPASKEEIFNLQHKALRRIKME